LRRSEVSYEAGKVCVVCSRWGHGFIYLLVKAWFARLQRETVS
jgi:hypothetical protein